MLDTEGLKNLMSESFGELSKDIRKLQRLATFYEQIYGVEVCLGCGGNAVFERFYHKLKAKDINTMEAQANSNFSFKKGVLSVAMTFGSSKILTPRNLTDEAAIEFLSINPKRIQNFAVFPKDWEAQVEAFKAKSVTKTTSSAIQTDEEPVMTDEASMEEAPVEAPKKTEKKNASKPK